MSEKLGLIHNFPVTIISYIINSILIDIIVESCKLLPFFIYSVTCLKS